MLNSAADLPPETIPPSASGSSLQSAVAQGPSIADIPLPFDRPHTISSSVYGHSRPSLSADTFEPPPSANANVNHGVEFDTGSNRVSMATPKTAEIYARPSLLIGKDAKAMPVAVATPTVPATSGECCCFDEIWLTNVY
jgi:hypothetical protein